MLFLLYEGVYMTTDGFTILSTLFELAWKFLTEWHVPGTNVTPAGFFLLIGFIGVNLRAMKRITFTSDSKSEDT